MRFIINWMRNTAIDYAITQFVFLFAIEERLNDLEKPVKVLNNEMQNLWTNFRGISIKLLCTYDVLGGLSRMINGCDQWV